MEIGILKKCFLYFYERDYNLKLDLDKQLIQNLLYQLQAVGICIDDGYDFLLNDGKVLSLELAYSLKESLQIEQSKQKSVKLSGFAIERLNELQTIKDIVICSDDMQKYFKKYELEREKHILYWMGVVSSTNYINNNIATNPEQTLDILNKYFDHNEINKMAVNGNHLEKVLIKS